MDRFVWLDSEHVANLDAIAYFKVDGDQLVNVIFRGVGQDNWHQIQVEGEYASNLNRLLKEAANPHAPTEVQPTRFVVIPRDLQPVEEEPATIAIDKS